MDFEKQGYKFSLLDEPLQKHVVAWERARVDMQNDGAKDILQSVVTTLNSIKITERSADVLLMTLQSISKNISAALQVIRENQSMTVSSDRSEVVEASIRSGWITSLAELQTVDDKPVWIDILNKDVGELKPWLVQWIAAEVAGLYNRSQKIPNA